MDYEKILEIMIKKDPQTWWGEYPPKEIYRKQRIKNSFIDKSWNSIFSNQKSIISLYVNIPICEKRCLFCKYYSKIETNKKRYDQYLDALEGEIVSYGINFKKRKLDSVYIGGGTPTILTEQQLTKLFYILNKYFHLNSSTQVVVEGTPESLTKEKLIKLKELKVDRLTIGAQSFDERILKMANRGHGVKEIFKTFKNAKMAGFDNINLDILFELPGETKLSYEKTLKGILKLKPTCLSFLFFVSGRRVVWSGRELVNDVSERRKIKDEMLPKIIKELKSVGYQAVSGMSDDIFLVADGNQKYLNRGIINRYNLKPVLGLGASAGSWQGFTKYFNARRFDKYIEAFLTGKARLFHGIVLSKKDLIRRYLIHCFAIGDFCFKSEFKNSFDCDPGNLLKNNFSKMMDSGLVKIDANKIYLVADWQEKIKEMTKNKQDYSRQELIALFCLRYLFSRQSLKLFLTNN